MSHIEPDLWSFSLRVYRAPGVADACVWLQDHRRLDVNVVLFSVWTGLTRGALDGALMAEAEALSTRWASRVVHGLRAVRRELSSTAHEELLVDVQRAELAAEKIEQKGLEALVARLPVHPSAGEHPARLNLMRYLEAAGVTRDPEVEARLTLVLEAALGG